MDFEAIFNSLPIILIAMGLITVVGAGIGWVLNRVLDYFSIKAPIIYWALAIAICVVGYLIIINAVDLTKQNQAPINLLLIYSFAFVQVYFLIPVVDGTITYYNTRYYYNDGTYSDYTSTVTRPGFWRKAIIQTTIGVIVSVVVIITRSLIPCLVVMILEIIWAVVFGAYSYYLKKQRS